MVNAEGGRIREPCRLCELWILLKWQWEVIEGFKKDAIRFDLYFLKINMAAYSGGQNVKQGRNSNCQSVVVS